MINFLHRNFGIQNLFECLLIPLTPPKNAENNRKMVQGKHGDKYDLAIYQQIRATSGYKGFRYEYPSIQKVAISQMTKV